MRNALKDLRRAAFVVVGGFLTFALLSSLIPSLGAQVNAVAVSPGYWWSTPTDLAQAGNNSSIYDIKMSDDGTKVVAGWTFQTTGSASDVYLRAGTVTSTGVSWGTATTVDVSADGSSNRQLQFGISSDGSKLTATWINLANSGARNGKQAIKSASATISGTTITVGSVTSLNDDSSGTSDTGKYPSISMSDDGTKVGVAWYNSNNGGNWVIKARSATVSGTTQTWGATSSVTAPVSGDNDDIVNIVISSDGTKATALWWNDGAAGMVVRSASATISGNTQTWGSVTSLTTVSGGNGGRIYQYSSLALSADGSTAVAIWKYGSGGGGWAIQTNVAAVSGTTQTWGTSTTLSTNGSDSPSVKISNDGTMATAVWNEANANYQYLVHSKSATISGTVATWGADTQLSEAGASGLEPVIDLSNDGTRAVVLWRRNVGSESRSQASGATISGSTATWQSSGNLSLTGGSVSQNPRVAIAGAAGNAAASWTRVNGAFLMAQSAVSVLPSSDADLASLAISGSALNPTFSSSTTNYSEDVANSVSNYSVMPTVNDVNATVSVNGVMTNSGSTSSSIPLSVGANTVTVVVTAQDGTTTKTYTITVTRAAAPSTTTTTTVPSSTSATTTVPENSASSMVPMLVNGKAPEVGAGSGQFTLADGSMVPVPVKLVNGDIRVGNTSFNMVLDTSGQRAIYEGSNIVIDADKKALVSGHGFLPNSIVEVWVFSSPTFLGTAQVNSKGEFSKYFTIPETLPSGKHTLQAEGLNTENNPRAVSAGVILRRGSTPIGELPRTGYDSSIIQWIALALLGLGWSLHRRGQLV